MNVIPVWLQPLVVKREGRDIPSVRLALHFAAHPTAKMHENAKQGILNLVYLEKEKRYELA
jgi:hypothetical protein